MKLLKYLVFAGDVLYILWILYNAINDGFRDINRIQGIVPLGLVVLLAFNMILLNKRI